MVKIGEYEFPDELYYSIEHTWAKVEPDGSVRVGITDFAQKMAGTIVFVRTLPVGKAVAQLKPFGTLETGKYVGKLYAPVSGAIATTNAKLREQASIINKDPYVEGWIIVIKPSNLDGDLKNLMKSNSPEFSELMNKKIAEVEAKAKAKLAEIEKK